MIKTTTGLFIQIINMPLKNVQSRESSLLQTLMLVNMFTYSYKQSNTHESCQNKISTNKSIDSAHCETFSQCQPWKYCFDLSCYARNYR